MLASQTKLSVLLIQPPSASVDNDRVEPPLGLLYIAAAIQQQGIATVSLLDLTGAPLAAGLKKLNKLPSFDLYGISALSTTFHSAVSIAKRIKEKQPDAIVVMGGAHPTAMPNETIALPEVDYVIAGEAEEAFCHLIYSINEGGFSSKILYGYPQQPIDAIAFPARHLVDYHSYSRKLNGKPVVSMISSRGCRYRCIHCNSLIMGGGSRTVRYRSVENIIEEISLLRPDFSAFRFNDDHFTGNPNLSALLNRMTDFNMTFRIFARIEDLTARVCQELKKAGCLHINVGLESLNARNLKILGKQSQINFFSHIKNVKEAGMIVRASFMVGLPFDSTKSIQSDFEKASQLGIDEFAIYPLIPYPGTPIWQHPEKLGYTIVNREFGDYVQIGKKQNACFALSHKNFTFRDVKKWRDLATHILLSNGAIHMNQSKLAT